MLELISLHGLVEKVYRAFIVSVGKMEGLSSVAQYIYLTFGFQKRPDLLS